MKEPTSDRHVLPKSHKSPSFDQLLVEFQGDLEQALDRFLVERIEATAAIGASTRELTEPLRDFVERGGKRIRPALVHFARRAAGGDSEDLLVEMAVELLHTYLLIHDDIMDRAETRRGAISAHRLFEREHQNRDWVGDAEKHGEAGALLLGDLAHAYSAELFRLGTAGSSNDPRVDRCFGEMCSEVVIGQYLEMTAPFRENLEQEDLLTILRLKSGRYSVERPIQLGALLGGASDPLLEAFSRYGMALGEAFQLQDDLLGVFGDREEVGKPVGGDLEEGKSTVLVSLAVERAADAEREVIRSCLSGERNSSEDIERVRGIVEDVGARQEVEGMVADRLQHAAAELSGMDLTEEGEVFFSGLVEYLRERRS